MCVHVKKLKKPSFFFPLFNFPASVLHCSKTGIAISNLTCLCDRAYIHPLEAGWVQVICKGGCRLILRYRGLCAASDSGRV